MIRSPSVTWLSAPNITTPSLTIPTIVSGAAMGDLSGYTLTLTGMEPVPANFLLNDLDTLGFNVIITD